MKALLIKMSSMGDVVHALPAVTDAAVFGVRFDWVVEEAFAAIPGMHPAVENVISIGWRRWRRDLWSTRGELQGFSRNLRASEYDLVLDAQGLLKSACVLARSRGRDKVGFDRRSARESLAASFYHRRVGVPTSQHAVDRQRQLFASAFGYVLPQSPPDFGLATGVAQDARCVLLHGTTWTSKHWPEVMWREIARKADVAGMQVVLPWGNPTERQRAERIAAGGRARVLDALSMQQLIDELKAARLVVGVDSGLTHLAGAMGVATVTIYGSTDSSLTGCRGASVLNLQAQFPCAPCLSRDCRYQGEVQTWQDQPVSPACYSRLHPDSVWNSAMELLDADRVLHI